MASSKVYINGDSSPDQTISQNSSIIESGGPPADGLKGFNINNKNAMFLSWEDLCVTVLDRKKQYGRTRKPILQGLTGYARPGEVLAVMGPSGCGKSTLLDTLAGRLDANTRQAGEILVNGRKQCLAYGTSAYVTQDDFLTWTLTVKEAVYYSAQLQLPDSMPLMEKKERAEMTIKEMGLQEAMNTRIGSWGNKGLSRGQMRRVSICMEILTRPKLLFLDEPTSGLDSAASYYVMRRIVNLAKVNGMTVIASIHQPSSEVFGLFHNLCLLSMGRMVYFGPSHETEQFFQLNGFQCPSPDHYLRTINTDFDEDMDQDFQGNITAEEVIGVLVNSYESSSAFERVRGHIAEIRNRKRVGEKLERQSHACFSRQFLILTRRSYKNMYRDPGYYWLRLIIYIALTLALGTVFYDIGSDYGSIQARGSILMFVTSFLTIMAVGGFPSFVEGMKVFQRERLNGHYGSGAFVLANTLSSMPFLLVISLIPGALSYYLAGLQPSFRHFFYYTSVLFLCMMLVECLMMAIASMMPEFLMGLITSAGIQGIMILSGGFFRLPNDLPRVLWKYPLYYIAFHKYAYQGLFKNEFEGLEFSGNEFLGQQFTIKGDYILRNILQVEMSYSKWADLGILLGMVILYRMIFFGILKMNEKFKPVIRKVITRKAQRVLVNPSSDDSAPSTVDRERSGSDLC